MILTRTRPCRLAVLALLLATVLAVGTFVLSARPARAAATFTVTLPGDAPDLNANDNVCDASTAAGRQCTLRAAIQQANATPDRDTISFNIPGGGIRTIRPGSVGLPTVTQPVIIDGYTQPGASPNTAAVGTNAALRIVLDGTNVRSDRIGLDIRAANSLVRGLVVTNFVDIGIYIAGEGVTGVQVAGCFIGTNAGGTLDRGNFFGVVVLAPNTTIGGARLGARNLISGNSADGVSLRAGAGGSRVFNNLIGTTKTGSAPLGNSRAGVFSEATDISIGAFVPAQANVIAFNATDGVAVFPPGVRNQILINSIFANGEEGIDLNLDGPSANDPQDADGGANTTQNFPTFFYVQGARVQGDLSSTPHTTFVLRFFSNLGNDREGTVFEGQLTVTTDADGKASFVFEPSQPIRTGRWVTATATTLDGNTSEFSEAETVQPPADPV